MLPQNVACTKRQLGQDNQLGELRTLLAFNPSSVGLYVRNHCCLVFENQEAHEGVLPLVQILDWQSRECPPSRPQLRGSGSAFESKQKF